MADKKIINYDDLMLGLCDSVSGVLTEATRHKVKYAPMVQRISKTTLTPDIGTFVMFTGSFSGMVVINFPKETAMELYGQYMTAMGIPEGEQARNYTSEEVSNALGELMNQILGNFTKNVNDKLHTSITQSQPKMLALPRELQINISVNLDNPRYSKVTFSTEEGKVFFLELAMDNTEFDLVREFEEHSSLTPDEILAAYSNNGKK
jgi:chemotaxis protein CheY-P-specific phosphatase CheC